jgi:hypothetical protein
MDLPPKLLLSVIIPRNAYLDKKSKEQSTGETNPKYKLAGNAILDHFFFNILTKRKSACIGRLTLCIENQDWEDKAKGSLLGRVQSYCDLTKYELLSKNDLIQKMKDRLNGFPYAAKLSKTKCGELDQLQERLQEDFAIPQDKKNIINSGVALIVKDVLKKLQLD